LLPVSVASSVVPALPFHAASFASSLPFPFPYAAGFFSLTLKNIIDDFGYSLSLMPLVLR
jgi:hypothetical protein